MPTSKIETELTQIDNITDYQQAKNKRGAQRSKTSHCTAAVTLLTSSNASTLKKKDIEKARTLVERNETLLEALQRKCEELQPRDIDTDAEAVTEERYSSELTKCTELLDTVEERYQIYRRCEKLYERLNRVQSIPDSINTEFTRHEVDQCIQCFDDLKDDLHELDLSAEHEIDHIRKDIAALVTTVMTRLAKESASTTSSSGSDASAPSTRSTTVTTSTPIVIAPSRPSIHLPKFDGRPTSWVTFSSVVKSTLNGREDMSEAEKWSYLLKSMDQPDATRLVNRFGKTKDCYQSAFRELELKYGRPCIVYPHHVRALLKYDKYSYNRASFDRFREEVLPARDGLKDCHGATLDQFLAAMLLDRFDTKLRHEWDLHRSHLRSSGSSSSSTVRGSTDSTVASSRDSSSSTLASATALSDDVPMDAVNPWDIPPTFQELLEFICDRELTMSELTPSRDEPSRHSSKEFRRSVNRVKASPSYTCSVCNDGSHPLSRCSTYLGWDANKRIKFVQEQQRCENCLSSRHSTRECTSKYNCRNCEQRHHTLLHRDQASTATHRSGRTESTQNSVVKNQPRLPPSQPLQNASVSVTTAVETSLSLPPKNEEEPSSHSFTATAIVAIRQGSSIAKARVLMDSAAELTAVTEDLVSSLKLQRIPRGQGLSSMHGTGPSKAMAIIPLSSLHDSSLNSLKIAAHIVPRMDRVTPPPNIKKMLQLPCIRDKSPIADPYLGGRIDILLGAKDVSLSTLGEISQSTDRNHTATRTLFGWTLHGARTTSLNNSTIQQLSTQSDKLDELLQLQWELDKVHENETLSENDQTALTHYRDTVELLPTGLVQVQLPRKNPIPSLGETRPMAMKRFLANERSLQRRGELDAFRAVLDEYLSLGHAEKVPKEDLSKPTEQSYYLPAHGVIKESSSTTRLRAVFDASAKSTTQVSLNDTLLPGPNLLPNIFNVLVRFRGHLHVATGDVSKMFRQVVLHPQERDYHRFLKRNENGAIADYRMTRLTFGVTTSPFIANQTLHHIASIHQQEYPEAAKAICEMFYVDDLLAGADNIPDLTKLITDISNILSSHGLHLRKWRASEAETLQHFPENLKEASDQLEISDPTSSAKALGVHWEVYNDTLHIAIPTVDEMTVTTKRHMASTVAKLYDVLGLYAPFVIRARILLRRVWQASIGWDDVIPEEHLQAWNAWIKDLSKLVHHSIVRSLCDKSGTILSQSLHGFSDASEEAYGASVYLRTVYTDRKVTVVLVAAKSRVTKLKVESIPRMELVAARLLTQLLSILAKTLNISTECVHAWSDSSIVLAWLKKDAASLKSFVAHRVTAITRAFPAKHWRHVRSKHNPADLASRGVSADELLSSTLWWHGPEWLVETPEKWPKIAQLTPSLLPELKPTTALVHQTTLATLSPDIWAEFDSFREVVRVVAWMLKFLHERKKTSTQPKDDFDVTELKSARVATVRVAQWHTHKEIISILRQSKNLPATHSLRRFDVSLNTDGLLQVSGRVRDEHTAKPEPKIFLSPRSPITKLFLKSIHFDLSHPGIAATIAILSESFYIPGLRNQLKRISRACVRCQRAYSHTVHQRMGLQPTVRTTPALPFQHVGLDFAGPVYVRQGHVRKPRPYKAYICVFVCMATKAVHLDLCEDLSTAAFMDTFKRFIGRRGLPSQVFSDNGTNFAGAKAEIKEIQDLILNSGTLSEIQKLSLNQQIQWRLIPPRTPHFGGLWESAVRCMKTLLRKLLEPRVLTPFQLYSVLVRAEAILNSRPIVQAYSTDPDEPRVLTSGHFLIGRPLLSLPQSNDAPTTSLANLANWKLVCKLNESLWSQWKTSYVQSLQARDKWYRKTHNFQIGDIALLKDESITSPQTWPVVEIVAIYPGSDDITRVVDVKLKDKVYRRSTDRLILLIPEEEGDQPFPPCMSGLPQTDDSQCVAKTPD